MKKTYKKLYVEIDEEVIKVVKELAKEDRVFLSSKVEELLIKALELHQIIIK